LLVVGLVEPKVEGLFAEFVPAVLTLAVLATDE
jgi:hypothetical protein